MKYGFIGSVVFDLRLRLLGSTIIRQLRANYQYTPPWPHIDPETGSEVTRLEGSAVGLDILARPRAEGPLARSAAARGPYWTRVNDLLALGVLNLRIWDQLDAMIDADARHQDLERRQKANPGAPSLPNIL